MPAEWETHAATWLAWPHRRSDWPGKFAPIPWVYAEIVRHLHCRERVRILVNDESARKRATGVLRKSGVDLTQVDWYEFPTDRVWTRDFGPTFVRDESGSTHLIDWHFNGWAKYPDWSNDDTIPGRIAVAQGRPVWRPEASGRRMVLEGGSIDVNGAGLLLTTEECLLSPVQARNPGLSREDLEAVMGRYLGVRKVLWLNRGIAGDDTHGHIDDLARFVGPGTVVTVREVDSADENHAPLEENWERLQGMTNADGRKLTVAALPMPSPLVFAGRRLPASYANFYVANGCVLVPTFNDVRDREALGILAELFPGRDVIGIHAVDLVWGLGTLHCMTQQEPSDTT